MRVLIAAIIVFAFSVATAKAQDPSPTTLAPSLCTISKTERIVPNILGFAPVRARQIIEACGLVYDDAEDVHTLSYEARGRVGDQEPSGGTVAKVGATVRGFVSVGLFVPDLTDRDADEAEKFLRDFRHGVNRAEEESSQPIGTVIRHEPKNAELYDSGTPVLLVESAGLVVPDLMGKPYSEAVKILVAKKLTPKHLAGPTEEVYPGQQCGVTISYVPRVVAFDPKKGLAEGGEVSFSTEHKLFVDPWPQPDLCP